MKTRISFMRVALALVVLLLGTSSVFAEASVTDCMGCHDNTTLITGKQTSLSLAVHGTGSAYNYAGGRSSCTACHSGGAFSKMIADGLTPNTVEAGDPNPTRQDCRTCHQIHTTNTAADWALETTAPVVLFALEDTIFDGGKGNLCAYCHQARRAIAAPDADGNISVTSTHWGPHHGPQSAMLLGKGGAGVAGVPSFHYRLTGDTCVTCHIGAGASHSFKSVSASCLQCHAEDDDLAGAQAAIAAQLVELHDLLEARGLYYDGQPVVGIYPAAQAEALWNYIFIAIEDGSLGTHNAPYTKALLNASIAALQ